MKKFGTAVILCGGKSSRMGFDKSKIRIGEKLMIELVAERLKNIFEEVVLVAENCTKFENLKYTVFEDLKKNYGPAGGIYTGLKFASSKYVFFLACDMPIVNTQYIQRLMESIEDNEYDAIMPKNKDWIEPLHAFYSKELIKDFERGIEENNLLLYDIIKKSNIKYIPDEVTKEYNEDMNMFVNLNYIKDLKVLEEIYK